MLQKNKRNLLAKLLSLVMLFGAGAGVAAAADFYGEQVSATASTADFAETLGMEDRAWGAGDDEYYFGGMNNGEYFNTADSVSGRWNSGSTKGGLIAANNGVDIMEYIYVNGQSARALSDANKESNEYKGSNPQSWLSNGGNYAPVFVESTNGSGLVIKVLKSYAGDTVEITFKAGFSLVDNTNTTLTLTKDVTFQYANGVLTKVQEQPKEPVALDNKITIGSWGEAEAGYTWIDMEFNGFTSTGIDWHTADADAIAANNNVDPMEYTYINGKSAREIYKEDSTSLLAQTMTGWHESYAVKVSTAYLAMGNFTIQLKAGFTLVGSDGVVYELKNDTAVYGWTDGVFGVYTAPEKPEIPDEPVAFEKVDVTDSVKIIKGSHNAKQSQIAIQLSPAVELTTNAWWNIYGAKLTEANNGVDIMNYIYINGQNIRTLTDDNRTNNTYTVDTASGWLANSDQCRPAFVETVGDGVYITVLHAFSTTKYTITLKAGFEMLNAEGKVYTLAEDVNFLYDEGRVTRVEEYTLSFEGLDDTVTLFGGYAIGELPAVPSVDGKLGVWQIDGQHVDVNTIYTYEGDKTASPVYYTATDASETMKIDDWGVINGANYTTIVIQNNGKGLLSDKLNCWNDNGANNALQNMACDIMDYIYINGRSARAIVMDNKNGLTGYPAGGSDDFALNLGGVFAPVTVETSAYEGGTIYVKVLREYLRKGTFTVTVKAGFKLVNGEDVIVLNKDVDLAYAVTYSGYAELATTAAPNGILEEPTFVPSFAENETHRYEFDGWYVTDVVTGEVSDTKWNFASDKVMGALTLSPKFNAIEKEKYTVTFDADNGAENATAIVYIGSYVKAEQIPAAPTKATDGNTVYAFLYWSLDGETEYDFSTPVTDDVTLVAVYTTEVYFTVTIGEDTATVLAGTKLDKPNDPTKDATAELTFAFDGWYNGETKWDFENDVVLGNLTLVAKYTESKRVYTITFNVTGNDAVTLNPVQVEYGTSYDLSNLLDGMDVSGYSYTIQVNGADKLSVKVVGDVTVDVTFTKKADSSVQSLGCMSSLGVSVLVSALAVGAVALKKKED